MSFNRDKELDLLNTKKVLAGEITGHEEAGSWLGHKKGTQAYLLDFLILRGVEDSLLLQTRASWRAHIDHLRYAHGLDVNRDMRGYWKISGEAYTGEGKRTFGKRAVGTGKIRNEITDEQYRAGYEMGRDVVQGVVAEDEALAGLAEMGINETSASYMMIVTEGLMNGHVFKRALKEGAYGWYLDWIYQDFGFEGLRIAVEGAKLHLDYRESDGAVLPRLRSSIERCERILRGKAPEPPLGPDNEDARGGREPIGRLAMVYSRYGQPEFRKNVLTAYNGRCAITGTKVERVVEAAHVRPYCEDGQSCVSNGILMRSDIHAMFDAGLLGIEPVANEPGAYLVRLSPSLRCEPDYWQFNGQRIEVPDDSKLWPDVVELRKHLEKVNQNS